MPGHFPIFLLESVRANVIFFSVKRRGFIFDAKTFSLGTVLLPEVCTNARRVFAAILTLLNSPVKTVRFLALIGWRLQQGCQMQNF
jgi:hypothetical protein